MRPRSRWGSRSPIRAARGSRARCISTTSRSHGHEADATSRKLRIGGVMHDALQLLALAISWAGAAGLSGLGCSSPRSENIDARADRPADADGPADGGGSGGGSGRGGASGGGGIAGGVGGAAGSVGGSAAGGGGAATGGSAGGTAGGAGAGGTTGGLGGAGGIAGRG